LMNSERSCTIYVRYLCFLMVLVFEKGLPGCSA
jgi:hypothetical protein